MKCNVEVKLEPVFEKLRSATAALSACFRGLVWEEKAETNFWWHRGFFVWGYFPLCTCFVPLLMDDKVIKPWHVYRAHLKRVLTVIVARLQQIDKNVAAAVRWVLEVRHTLQLWTHLALGCIEPTGGQAKLPRRSLSRGSSGSSWTPYLPSSSAWFLPRYQDCSNASGP